MNSQISTPPEANLLPEGSSPEGFGLPLQPAGCRICDTAYLVEASRIGSPCPNCGRGALTAQPARMRPEPPELLIPFKKSPADLLPKLQASLKPVWLRPADLEPQSLARRAVPVFWPMWLVDSDVEGEWKAEMGFDYQVKSSQESYASGYPAN